MRGLTDDVIKRLEHEDRAVEMIDEGHTSIRLETLRTRAEEPVEELQRKLEANIGNLPTLLSCQQGNGLVWARTALELLSRRLNETLNQCREQASVAEEVWQEARRHAVMAGQEHDETYNGIKRRLRGTVAKDLHELAISLDYVTNCGAQRVRWSTEAVMWQRTWELVDGALEEVRAMLALVERRSQEIVEYANNARRAMDAATQTSAMFPAGVLVDADWFRAGVAQAVPPNVPPKELISRVFRQWAHGLPSSERGADRFLQDTHGARTQLLLGKFQFDTLQRYIVGHVKSPLVHKAVTEFQKAATPQWLPAK